MQTFQMTVSQAWTTQHHYIITTATKTKKC